jgi:hypothetical protein
MRRVARALGFAVFAGACARSPGPGAAPPSTIVVGAAGNAAALPPPDKPLTIDDLLADGAGEHFPRRCRVASRGAFRFTARGAPASGRAPEHLTPPRLPVVVVDERNDLVRVVIEDSAMRVLVFFPRADLVPVPIAAAVVSESPARPKRTLAPRETGVRVAAGVDLAEIQRDDATRMRYVGGDIDGVAFQGWLPDDAFGEVWTEAPFAAVTSTGLVLEETSLWSDTPELLARFSGNASEHGPLFVYGVEALEARPSTSQELVRVVRQHIEVVGLVDEKRFKTKKPGDDEWRRMGFSRHWGRASITDTPRRTIKKGAPLFSVEENARIGVVLADAIVYLGETKLDDDRRAILTSVGELGLVTVAARTSDLAP